MFGARVEKDERARPLQFFSHRLYAAKNGHTVKALRDSC